MSKVRFTQLFNESMDANEIMDILEKHLKGEEFDKAKDMYDDFDSEDDFIKKYQDMAEKFQKEDENHNNEPSESNTKSKDSEGSKDSEDSEDSEELDDDSLSDEDIKTKKEENSLKEDKKDAQDAVHSRIDSKATNEKLSINSKEEKACDEALKRFGLNKEDMEEWEQYFGYKANRQPKDEIKVLFGSNGSVFKPNEVIKNTDPRFYDVACMNEFALYSMAVELYNTLGYGEKILGDVAKCISLGKYGNHKIKDISKDTLSSLCDVRLKLKTDKAMVEDPVTGQPKEVPATILPFIYTKIVGHIINVAKGNVSVQTRVLKKGPYQNFYMNAAKLSDSNDILEDVIQDGFNVFLGGIYAARAEYEDILQTPHLGTAGSTALNVFDIGLTDFSIKKNPFLRMKQSIEDGAESWGWANVKKLGGKSGRIKTLGVSDNATQIANGDSSIEAVTLNNSTGYDKDDALSNAQKSLGDAKSRSTHIRVRTSPISYIASKVGDQYSNFLKAMTRAGSKSYSVPASIFGKKFYSEEDIKNAKTDKERQNMINSNKAWEGVNWANITKGNVSLDTPVGDDGKSTLMDTLASDVGNGIDFSDVEELDTKISKLKNEFDKRYNMACLKVGDNDTESLGIQIRSLFATMASAKFVYMGINHPSASVRNALSATFGKVAKTKSGKTVFDPTVKPNDLLELGTKSDYSKYEKYMGNSKELVSSFGVRDYDFRDAILAVRSKKAFYIFNKVKEGPEMLDNINNFLQDINERCAKKIIELTPGKTTKDLEDAKIINKNLSSYLSKLESKISELGDNVNPEIFKNDSNTLVDWVEAFSIDMAIDDKFLNNVKERPELVDAIKAQHNFDITSTDDPKVGAKYIRNFGKGEYTIGDSDSGYTTRDPKIGNLGLYKGKKNKYSMIDLNNDLPMGTSPTVIKEHNELNDFFTMVFNESNKK